MALACSSDEASELSMIKQNELSNATPRFRRRKSQIIIQEVLKKTVTQDVQAEKEEV